MSIFDNMQHCYYTQLMDFVSLPYSLRVTILKVERNKKAFTHALAAFADYRVKLNKKIAAGLSANTGVHLANTDK